MQVRMLVKPPVDKCSLVRGISSHCGSAPVASAVISIRLMSTSSQLLSFTRNSIDAYVERIHSRPTFKGLIEEEQAAFSGS